MAVEEGDTAQGEHDLALTPRLLGPCGRRFLRLGEHGAQGAVPVEGLGLVLGETAVSQDDQPVGERVDLTEPVGDVQHRDAVVAHPLDEREEALRLGGGERGGRLVEDQQPWAGGQRAGQDQQLPVGDAEFGDIPLENGVTPAEVQGGLDLAGAGQYAAPAQERVAARLGQLLEDQVLGDREAGHDALADALVHGLDTQLAGGQRGVERGGLAVHAHFPAMVRVDPRQDLDQRGLARAVRAEQRDDAARGDVQRDGGEHRPAAEGHADVTEAYRRDGLNRGVSGRHWGSSPRCSPWTGSARAAPPAAGPCSRCACSSGSPG